MYEDGIPMPADPEPDPRVIAMQRVVGLEEQCYSAQREAEQRAKMAAIVQNELREAREELHRLLGVSTGGDGEKYVPGFADAKAQIEATFRREPGR